MLDSQKYSTVNQYAKLIEEGFQTQEGQVFEHTYKIVRLVTEPLPIDHDLCLQDIYVTPTVKKEQYQESSADEPKSEEKEDLIQELLDHIENSTNPVIVHGELGHGKTSAMRMLATVLYRTEKMKVLMYEFKHLGNLNRGVYDVLQGETPFVNRDFFEKKRMLLIFDGMDERQLTEGNERPFADFIYALLREVRNLNEKPNTQVCLILTGRSQFVQQVKNTFTSPYVQYEIQNFSADQVRFWLKKFNQQKTNSADLTLE